MSAKSSCAAPVPVFPQFKTSKTKLTVYQTQIFNVHVVVVVLSLVLRCFITLNLFLKKTPLTKGSSTLLTSAVLTCCPSPLDSFTITFLDQLTDQGTFTHLNIVFMTENVF